MGKRRAYSNQFKKQVLEGFYSGKLSLDQIKKEWGLITADLTRFRTQLLAAGEKLPSTAPITEFHTAVITPISRHPEHHNNNSNNIGRVDMDNIQDKDKFIAMLLAELGKATLKIQQLEAQLGGGRRATDNPVFRLEGA